MSSYATLMQGGRIVAFHPESSKFYKLILNGKMPPKEAPLTAAEKKAISDWITSGAQNDGPAQIPTVSPSPSEELSTDSERDVLAARKSM